MSGRIPEDLIAQVRDRTDIVQVVGQYVELKRSGANHKGLCPFHEEKTASFNVNGERQFFHCFGCNESGDVFAFLMKIDGRRFGEVVEDLAGRAGIELPRAETPAESRAAAQRRSERQRGLELNERVAKLYRTMLLGEGGEAARAYLGKRGIGDEVSEAFRLGYASSANLLVRLLQQHDIPLAFAEKLGLVARRRQGDGYHDRFWDRLIFPLLGVRAEVLGFGGRMLGEREGPKYVNTPETPLYRKGELLYGLSVAAPAMRRSGVALLVEGNFDVLQMHQAGFANTVAPMGTAVTEAQLRLLRRFCPEIVALFDGDAAGRAAARRAVPAMVAAGLEAKIATLPPGEDPDSLLAERGATAVAEIIEKSVPCIDYLIADLRAAMEDSIPGRARVLEQVAPVVRQLQSPVARDLYVDKLSMTLRIDRETARRAMAGGPAPRPSARPEPEARRAAPEGVGSGPLDPRELDPLAILVAHPHLFPRAEQSNLLSLLTNEGLRATYSAAMEMQRASGQVQEAQLLQKTGAAVRDAVAHCLLSRAYARDGDPTRALDDCIAYLQRKRVDGALREVRGEMAEAQSRGDSAALARLRERLVGLIEERRHL